MKNKMIGNYSNEGVLNISATNLQEFESLIKKAKKQADELQDTINQLEFFNFSFKFSTDKDNQFFFVIFSAFIAEMSKSIKETIAFINKVFHKASFTKRAIQYWEKGKKSISLENADRLLTALSVEIKIGKTESR